MVAETHARARAAAFRLGGRASAAASLALVCLASPAGAGPARVDGLRILEAGVYAAKATPKAPADTPSGVVLLQKDIRLAQPTTELCPRPGVTFGVRYVVDGAPPGAPVEIVVRVNFPRSGVRYPGARKRETFAEQSYTREIGAVRFADYTIGGDWDARSGRWSFQFWSAGRMIGEQAFDLKRSACKAAR